MLKFSLRKRVALAVIFLSAIVLSTFSTLVSPGGWWERSPGHEGNCSSENQRRYAVTRRNEKAPRAVATYNYQRIAVVQYTGDSSTETRGYKLARDVMKAYAAKHSYAYYLFQEGDVKIEESVLHTLKSLTKHHNWRRPFMLSQIIREGKHDWIAYFDTDVIITDPSIPLEKFIDSEPTGKNMIIADDSSGINNGVFFQKASNWSLSFNDIWWNERPVETKNMGDNWPFMSALLVAWASSSAETYEGECSMSSFVEMEDWAKFYPCYLKHVDRFGSRTTHPDGCTPDFPAPCGSAVVEDPHIKAVWGINSGIGFGGKNAWDEHSFILHLAGKAHQDRDDLLQHHAQIIIAAYSLTENMTASASDVKNGDQTQEVATELDLHEVPIKNDNRGVILRRPISFSAPEELWQPVVSYKTEGFAPVIPGNASTYTFDDEDGYHKSYRYALSPLNYSLPCTCQL